MTSLLGMTTLNNGFAKKVQLELKRASRYRTFISLIIIDLSSLNSFDEDTTPTLEELTTAVRSNIRETDEAATLDGNRIGLLVPETSRQGAEIAARRIHEVVKTRLNGIVSLNGTHPVRLEIASFPDAGGNRTVAEFIEELAGTETA